MNYDNIISFLKKFFDIYEDKNFYIELRIFAKRGSIKREFFKYIDILDNPLKIIKFLKKTENNNVYFSVLPRTNKIGSSEGVEYGRVLWIDFDFHDLPDDIDLKSEIKKKYDDFKKKIEEIGFVYPNIVIYTGKGVQMYWVLDRCLTANDIKKYEESLISFFKKFYPNNIDPVVKDLARVMRLPYTNNVKYSKPIEVEIWQFTTMPVPYKFFKEFLKTVEKVDIREQDIKTINIFTKRISKWKRKEIVKFFSNFWLRGFRNQLEIYLIGLLLKNGVKPEYTKQIIKKICEMTNDEEISQRLRNVEYHYKHRYELSERLKGISGINEIIWNIINSDIPEEELKKRPKLRDFIEEYKNGDLIKDDIEFYVNNFLKSVGLTENIFEKKTLSDIGITLNDLLNEPIKPIEYYIYPLVPKGKLITIAGRPASFKSLFSLSLALSIATGRKFLDKFKVIEKGRVAYIDAENGADEIRRRVRYLLGNQPVEEVLGKNFIYIPYTNISDLEKILPNDDSIQIVIFDSMRRFLKGDEARSEVINRFYLNFLKPLKEKGKTIILIHHFRKRKQGEVEEDIVERIRGSSDIVAMLDIAYVLEKKEEEVDIENGVMRSIVNFLKVKERSGIPIFDFNFSVEKDDKLGRTEMIFRGASRVLTLEERVKEKIAEILRKEQRKMKTKELMEEISYEIGEEVNKTVFTKAIGDLMKAGTVIRIKRGLYKYNERLLEKYMGDNNEK